MWNLLCLRSVDKATCQLKILRDPWLSVEVGVHPENAPQVHQAACRNKRLVPPPDACSTLDGDQDDAQRQPVERETVPELVGTGVEVEERGELHEPYSAPKPQS